MLKVISFLLIGFLSLSTFASSECLLKLKDKNKELCVGFEWVDGITEKRYSSFDIFFWDVKDPEKKKISPELNFFPYVWMYMDNGFQHGSKALKVEKSEQGLYRISNIYLIPMKGFWSFQIALSEDQIPQTTSLPAKKKPVKDKLFLKKYKILDNAKFRIDFFKFAKFNLDAFAIWDGFPTKNDKNSLKLYFFPVGSNQISPLVDTKLSVEIKFQANTSNPKIPAPFTKGLFPYYPVQEIKLEEKSTSQIVVGLENDSVKDSSKVKIILK